MSTPAPRAQLGEELLRRLAAALRAAQLYSTGHPIIARNIEALGTAVQLLHTLEPTTVIGIVGDEVIVDDQPVAKADALAALVRRLTQSGVERVAIERGVTRDELATFVQVVSSLEARPEADEAAFPPLSHIRVGRIAAAPPAERTDRRHGDDAAAVLGGGDRRHRRLGERRHRGAAGCRRRPDDDRGAGAGGRAEPDGAARADRAQATTTTTPSRTW